MQTLGPVVTDKTIHFTMVLHPGGWTRVGNAYPSPESAKEWVPFVRGRWRGLKVKVEPCRLEFHDGVLSEASKRILDEKFNLDS